MKKESRFSVLTIMILFLSSIAFLPGCLTGSASIEKNGPVYPKSKVNGRVAIEKPAKDIRGKPKDEIGRNTVTLFAFPGPSVYSTKPLEEQMMKNIGETLEDAGFQVEDKGYPKLKCDIEKFYYSNYTWFYPVCFAEGIIQIKLSLLGEDGYVLWSKRFTACDTREVGFISFDGLVQKNLKQILYKLQEECTSDDFQKLLKSGNGRSVGTSPSKIGPDSADSGSSVLVAAPAVGEKSLASDTLSNESRAALMKLLDQREYRNENGIMKIQPFSNLLPEEERKFIYDKYAVSYAIFPAFGNVFFGMGSWLQGDYLGGIICSSTTIGGAALLALAGTNKNSPAYGAFSISGALLLSGGFCTGFILPFTFEANNNSGLKEAMYYFP